MAEFLWIEWNLGKIDNHALSTDEVEHAWRHRVDVKKGKRPQYGAYWESLGDCPAGRRIRMIWRWNLDDGEKRVFIITAY